MALLVIPIQVDAILLRQGCSCIGQDVNFQGLPYFNAKKGVLMNQDRPFLAESIIAQPFKNDSLFLDEGIHLHWTLPDLVTAGKALNGETIFPAAPNRWYVRKVKNNKSEEWIIESDYIWDAEDNTCPVHALCTIPLDVVLNEVTGERGSDSLTLTSGQQPYAYMGRKYTLREWQETSNPKERYWNHIKKEPLTAIGWGSLVFDTFYAHSRSVYGMHDSDLPGKEDEAGNEYSYTVVGWYDREFDTHHLDFIREMMAGLEHELQEERFADLPEEEFKKIYEERLNAAIVGTGNEHLTAINDLSAVQNTLCYGYIDMRQRKESHPAGEQIQVAVANTPAEAISALLIESAKKDLKKTDRMKEEEKLEALLGFEDLSNRKLDMAARLRELRHEKGFVSHEGLTNWRIVIEDRKKTNASGTPDDGADIPVPVLDGDIKDLENKLRTEQYRYDLKKNQLRAALDALYLDWSRYMQAMYPPEGQTREYPDVDAIRFHIRRNSLQQARTLKEELGVYPDLKSGKLTEGASGMGLTIARLITDIRQKLGALAEHPQKEYKLKQETGTAYWEALPPSLVLFGKEHNTDAAELLRYSNRLTQPDKRNTFLWLSDSEAGKIELKDRKAFTLAGLTDALNVFDKHRSDFGKDHSNKVNEWHTFRVEWKVELFPVAPGNQLTKSSSSFDPDFITRNYALQEEDTDFTTNPALTTLSLHANGSVYTGSSYVTNTIKQSYSKKIHDYLKTNEWVLREDGSDRTAFKDVAGTVNEMAVYENTLQGIELLGLTLTGFNEALIQQKSVTRLAPADPFGFASHREFANDIAALLHTGQGSSADPLSSFNPLRCGALKVVAIRLIDTFGRTCNLLPTDIVTSTPNRISQKESWVSLLPRLCQQATMSIRWRDSMTKVDAAALSAATTATGTLKSSPVCGWMLPVYMNQRIEFFDAFGKHLGGITHKGLWENSVFEYGSASSEDRSYIQNVQLSNLIAWILAKTAANPDFHESFIQILRDTCNNIMPESRTNPSLMEIIGGTPIAVTQIAVNLFIKGMPAFDLDWNAFRTELGTREGRNTRQFTKIRFPYSIGDFHKYNDGVVAYWDHKGGRLAGPAYFNSAVKGRLSFTESPGQLPLGLEDEQDYRYNGIKSVAALLLELAGRDHYVYKHEFTRHYVANGSRYWDILVNAGWIQLYQQHEKDIKRTFEHTDLHGAIDAAERNFTLLMHPRGVIHLTSGILPVKKLMLPEESYKTALRTIELTFLASPVIMPVNELVVSLHQDSRYEWSWLKAVKKKAEIISETNPPEFDRTLQRRHMKKDVFSAVWNGHYSGQMGRNEVMSAAEAWKQMITSGFLEVAPTFEPEAFAYFRQDKMEAARQEYDRLVQGGIPSESGKTQETLQAELKLITLVVPLLARLVRSILPFDTKAGAAPSQSLQEGWLSIKTSRKTL